LLALFLTSLPREGRAIEHEPMLSQVYHADIQVNGWWMSEKLDGVRAYWDGEALYSKNGVLLYPPAEFTAALPPFALEGELWGGRGTFEDTLSTVLRKEAHPGWLTLEYAVFDVPQARGNFEDRVHKARLWFEQHRSRYTFLVEQIPVSDAAHLASHLDEVVAQGGEGLMVRDPHAEYAPGRSTSILKVKRFEDAEATVVGHTPGAGRNSGRLGALRVENSIGLEFKIGSGFSDAQRQNPPPVGAVITYKYHGHYQSGIPKFPVFLRVRMDAEL
ncbi:MAG: DNA ligase, partial [Desulfuromonadaceae bacterium]